MKTTRGTPNQYLHIIINPPRVVCSSGTSFMRRRRFLEECGAGLSGLLAARAGVPLAHAAEPLKAREIAADVAIVGGGLGGCAAALAALRSGRSVVMTEPTDWIGGQLTQQAVPPDEHPWIEKFGGNASYFALRRGIRDYYREHYPLTAEARARFDLNPGNGGVSRLCHEPRVALAVLTAMLAPYASGGKLTVLLEHAPVRADAEGDRVRSVTVRDSGAGDDRTLVAPFFLDATELGDLLPMARRRVRRSGSSRRSETGDRHAPEKSQPENQQAFTCCFAMDYLAGEDHTIDRPAEYAFWRDYVPEARPALARQAPGRDATPTPSRSSRGRSSSTRPARARGSGSTGGSPIRRTSAQAPTPAGSRWSTGRRTTTGSAT